MGQNLSCSCTNQQSIFECSDYVDLPLLTGEDVYHLKACFDYLEPVNGVVSRKSIGEQCSSAPAYMQEILGHLEVQNKDLTFDEFYKFMKPKLLEVKKLQEGSVIKESNSTSVSCLLFPYKNKVVIN